MRIIVQICLEIGQVGIQIFASNGSAHERATLFQGKLGGNFDFCPKTDLHIYVQICLELSYVKI